eukprot:5664495-Prymnesium_polylepis.1
MRPEAFRVRTTVLGSPGLPQMHVANNPPLRGGLLPKKAPLSNEQKFRRVKASGCVQWIRVSDIGLRKPRVWYGWVAEIGTFR